MSLSTDVMPPNLPPILKQSELVGRRILERSTAKDLGYVQEIWIDPRYHHAVAFTCRSGLMGFQGRLFTWSQVDSIGDEAVVVSLLESVETQKPEGAERGLGCEVWTDAGNRVGKVLDYRFQAETGDIVAYLFSADSWGGLAQGIYALLPSAVVSMNGKRLIAEEAELAAATLVTGNVSQQTKAFLQDDLARTKQDLSSVMQGAQAIANQVRGKTQSLSQESKKHLAGSTEKLQDAQAEWAEKTHTALSQAAETLQDTQQHLKVGFSEVAGQLQDKTAQLKKQAQGSVADALETVQELRQIRTGAEDGSPISSERTDSPVPQSDKPPGDEATPPNS